MLPGLANLWVKLHKGEIFPADRLSVPARIGPS